MKTKFIRSLATAALALFLYFPSQSLASDIPPLHDGLESATKIFGELRQHFREVFIDPLAREQASRYLVSLSDRLSTLALDKERFTQKLVNAVFPNDFESLYVEAKKLEDDVSQIQSTLNKFFEPMPLSWRSRGEKIESSLHLSLSGKWQNLNDISKKLNMDKADQNDLLTEARRMVALTRALKSSVDALISELAQSRTVNSAN